MCEREREGECVCVCVCVKCGKTRFKYPNFQCFSLNYSRIYNIGTDNDYSESPENGTVCEILRTCMSPLQTTFLALCHHRS